MLIGLTIVSSFGAIVMGIWTSGRQSEKILRLERGNIEAQRTLEAEKLKRLDLERSLAPRQIPLIKEGTKWNIDSLKPFAGIQVAVQFLPDAEASRAAGNIAGLIREAGWNVANFAARPEVNQSYFDGVVVIPYFPVGVPATMPNAEEMRAIRRSEDAAESLVAFLKSNNWEARRALGARGEVAPNTVKVVVGFKPSPYFLPEEIKDALKEVEEMRNRP